MDYAHAGVNIDAGDEASRAAYAAAKTTFASRQERLGAPYVLEGGFAGALDMGDYLLIQNDDGTGTKAEIAERTGIYSTLGQDLCAMVVDDAVCVGAEVLSITNTFDVPKVEPKVLSALAHSLAAACTQEQVVIPGGEIAEMGNAVNKLVWNATAVGAVKKDQFITGQNVTAGDVILGLKGGVLRSNGVSLARAICTQAFGDDWHTHQFDGTHTWGEVLLTPSVLYHRTLLTHILGDMNTPRTYPVKALCHITGGGIPGNLPRVLPDGMGANLPNLHAPHPALKQLQTLGKVDEAECYRTWHSGTAMMLVVDPTVAQDILATLNKVAPHFEAQVIGDITSTPNINLTSQYGSGARLSFPR